jgi:hypothetical protein
MGLLKNGSAGGKSEDKFISVLSCISDFGANCVFQIADLDRGKW